MSTPQTSSFILIDDRDNNVAYSGNWVVGGTSHEYDRTVSSSLNVGDSFTVSFAGTRISVFGTYDSSSNGVKTLYSIDGGAAATATSKSSSGDSYQQLFWASDALSNGPHKLKVTMGSVNGGLPDGEGTIWFDYFNVSQSLVAVSSTGPSLTPSPSNTNQKPDAASTASSSSSSGTGVPAVVTSKKSSNGGLIGGIIAAVLIILLLVAGFFYWRRRRQRRDVYLPAPSTMHTPTGPPQMQPFLQTRPTTPMSSVAGSVAALSAHAAKPGFDARLTHAAPSVQPTYDPYSEIGASMFQSPLNAPTSYAPSTTAPSVTSTGLSGPLSVVNGTTVDGDSVAELKRRQKQVVDSYEQGIGSSYQAPLQHTDSGLRGDALAGPAELPPVYTAN
ncbi:Amidohydro-rel domain-containing protein [Mycena indigotica]|uniref:Amidohydro-rel domain-containing protein n=1 Tax=Mycena indigotica TaxID=2126181 RepID=A0A8H6SQ04_9AGAR|nr:Amidohydro-rel domain-containing protein [Mycena indigotica]KAF7303875.1 Amidohydro-rel domain-containing protein [Mycena indigotica]